MSRTLMAAMLAMAAYYLPGPCNAQDVGTGPALEEIIVTDSEAAGATARRSGTDRCPDGRDPPGVADPPDTGYYGHRAQSHGRSQYTYSNSTIVLRSITQANNSDVPVP